MASPELQEKSSLNIFDRKVDGMTNFNSYLHLLATEGVSALCEGPFQSLEDRNEYVRLLTARMTGTVLNNREKEGLRNVAYDLMAEFHGKEKSRMSELIVDNVLRAEVVNGVILGFEAKRLIPPGWDFPIRSLFD